MRIIQSVLHRRDFQQAWRGDELPCAVCSEAAAWLCIMCATCIDKMGKNMVYCQEHAQVHKCQHLMLELHAASMPRAIWCFQCKDGVEDCDEVPGSPTVGAKATPQLLRVCLDLDADAQSDSE
jgi:hypothetical protein